MTNNVSVAPLPIHLEGIGEEQNAAVFKAQKPRLVAKHRGCERDEHDRFMPMWFNGINMPVNVKD
ncbi:MAG: hypothetical protein ACI4OR_04560 [Alphaproteobacteria bacterium]